VAALVIGCTLMVRETRLALRNIVAEAELARSHFGALTGTGSSSR
jgi:hypothetical protein